MPIQNLPRSSTLFIVVSCVLGLLIAGCGGGNLTQTTKLAPATITSISPTTVPEGSAAFTLQVTGTGFVSGSTVTLNGINLPTTFVSSTQLSATVAPSLIATGGSFAVEVVDPDGQSASSPNGATATQLTVDNGQPTITHLMPSTAIVGSAATNVVITGTNFVQSSVASFGGAARTTTYQSATQLTMALTATDLEVLGTTNITVTNPAPGGGTSNTSTFSVVYPPAPMLTSVTPASAIVGSSDTAITIIGTGFTSNSFVSINGYTSVGNFVSATKLTATIPAQLLTTATTLLIYVQNSNGISSPISFAVVNPVPVISGLSPATVTAGAPDFTLSISGSGFINSSQVMINGVLRSTGGSNGVITARINASDVAAVGTVDVSVVNPGPGGGTSSVLKLKCIAGDNRVRTVSLPSNSLVWDPKQQRIYATIQASASSNASSVVAIDPSSGSVVASQIMPSEPDLLAISGDQQYLYVSLPAISSIARLKLPSLAPDIQFNAYGSTPRGQKSISDLQIAPGLPHTIAVAQYGNTGSRAVAVYDDGVARANYAVTTVLSQESIDKIQWGADATTIYGTTTIISGGPEFHIAVNASGATLASTEEGVFGDFSSKLLYDPTSTHLYDAYGNVVVPSTGSLLGHYPILNDISYEPTAFAIDSALDRVYFINNSGYPEFPGDSSGTQIQVFDQNQRSYIDAIYLPSTAGGGTDLIRWGSAGLAFISGNTICLLDGPFVAPGAVASSATGAYVIPAPRLTALSPESVSAGSPDTVVTISGEGFSPSTEVTWNSNVQESTYVSATEMQVTLPAAALASPVAGPIIAANDPNEALSNSLGFTVTPNLGTGMQFTALNLAGSDLVWDSATGLLYESVTAQDLVHGNTIASIDPVAGFLKSVQSEPSGPYVLALSQDNQYLYAGFSGSASAERYDLPAMTPDLQIPLGAGNGGIGNVGGDFGPGSVESCDFALSVQVAPGSPQTIAVTQGNVNISPSACGAVAIFDGATPRNETLSSSTVSSGNLTWGADSTALYAQSGYSTSSQAILSLSVSANGVTLNQIFSSNNYLGYRPHFDGGTGYIYSDGGAVTNPANGTQVGNFMASGLMVPDSTLGRAYFLGQTPNQNNYGQSFTSYTLQIFDLTHFTLLDSIVIPNVIGLPSQMVRWGASGIAFTTEGGNSQTANAPGMTYIISGPIITGAAGRQSVAPQTPHVQLTWHPGQIHPSKQAAAQ